MAMQMTKRMGLTRSVLVAGAAVIALVVVACAPQPTGPAGPTTTTTTSTTLVFQQPTGGSWTGFNMGCSANVYGQYFPFNQPASVNITAPASVSQGSTFFMMVTPGTFIVPIGVQGYYLTNMVGMTIRFPLSPNMQVVDTVMSSSVNAGDGYPSVTVEGTDLVYRVPGPFQPGVEIQMPQVRVEAKAIGAPGSVIQVRLASLGGVAYVGPIHVPTYCTPPNPLVYALAIPS